MEHPDPANSLVAFRGILAALIGQADVIGLTMLTLACLVVCCVVWLSVRRSWRL